jgi:hypothetical protein
VSARAVMAGLAAAALLLVGVELALGARDYGEVHVGAPCAQTTLPPGGGLDRTVQRIVIGALDRASCGLGTTRERLLLSLSPNGGARFRDWNQADEERLLRDSLVASIDDAEKRGDLNGVEAGILRELAQRAPVQLLVQAASHIDDLLGLANLIP